MFSIIPCDLISDLEDVTHLQTRANISETEQMESFFLLNVNRNFMCSLLNDVVPDNLE